MTQRYLLGQSQRRVLGIQSKASVYAGQAPSEQGTALAPTEKEGKTPSATDFVGTLTTIELEELSPWLFAVTLGATGNTDLAAGYLAADVVKIHDSDDSHELSIVWNEAETGANRTFNFLVHGGNRTLDLWESLKILDGQDIELHASGGEKAQLAIDTQNAERTLDLSENLTIADGYNITLQALGQTNSLILNENLTIGDGTNITITGVTAARTITLNENLTIGNGTDITITGVTQANTLTMNESFTIGNGSAGTLTYGSTCTLTVELSSILNQDLTTDAGVTFASVNALTLTAAATGFTIAGGTSSKTLTCDDSFVVSTQLAAIGANTGKVTCNFTNVNAALAAADATVDLNSQDLTGVAGLVATRLYVGDNGYLGSTSAPTAMQISASGNIGVGVAANAGIRLYFSVPDAQSAIYMGVYGLTWSDAVTNWGVQGGALGGGGTTNIGVKGRAENATYNFAFRSETGEGDSYFCSDVDIHEHNAATVGLKLGGTLVTASAAELNILDGVTSTAAELTLLAGSIAGTIVNSKGVIYGSSGEVNGTTLEIGGNLLNITTDGTDTTVVGALNITGLAGADPTGHKTVHYNTTTKSLFYDNT